MMKGAMMAKTVIFQASNDRGEPLIEVAAKQGEIWTARARILCEKGTHVLLKRSGRGKVEYEGVVKDVERGWLGYRDPCWACYKKAGMRCEAEWKVIYYRMNHKQNLDADVYFIHITNIKPYVTAAERERRSDE